jgi:hypothetical protein
MRLWMLAAACATVWAADLPVRQVILYKNGVGYVERAGTLAAGESARLDFKASDMNDVLKSLMIVEKGGGKVAGVRYDSMEPLDRKLGEFPFRIEPQAPVAKILDQFRGARIEVNIGGQRTSGVLVSARHSAAERQPERQEAAVLLDSGELRTLELGPAAGVRFLDPAAERKFKEYLAILAESRAGEARSVYIDSTDRSAREITASYMAPMPAWKSSYRLIFTPAAEALLEGWAIIDNTTADDWTHIRLALVSGRPVSFISRLYEPKHVTRQVASLPEDQAAGPQLFEGAVDELRKAPAPPPEPAGAGVVGGVLPRRMMAARTAPAEAAAREQAPSTAAVTTETREVGEWFEYRFSQPVTVRRNESAMLPFLQQKVSARKLLIYSGDTQPHPTTAAEIVNHTGKTLDGGPITVFDSGAYSGEALMETLKSGDKRLIGYGVEPGVRVTSKLDSKSQMVREVRLNRGILTTKTARVDVKTYTARNSTDKPRTLWIEHPIRQGFTVLSPKPVETSGNHYRFELKLPASATASLSVEEEHVFETTVSVSGLSVDALLVHVQNKSISEAGRKQLQKMADLKRQIASEDAEIRRLQNEIDQIGRDQQRIRENINSLNRVAGQQEQVQRYAKQLAEQEARLAGLRDGQEAARKKKQALESELNRLIETAVF